MICLLQGGDSKGRTTAETGEQVEAEPLGESGGDGGTDNRGDSLESKQGDFWTYVQGKPHGSC